MPIDRSIPKFACEYCDSEYRSYEAALACENAGPPPEPLPNGTLVMLAPTLGRNGAPDKVTIGHIYDHEVRCNHAWGDRPAKPHYIAYDIEGAGHKQSFTSENLTPHSPGVINVDGAISGNVIHADRLETVLRESPERADELAEVLNRFGCETGPKQVTLAARQFYHHTWSGRQDHWLVGPMEPKLREALLTFAPIAGDEPYSLYDRERPSRTLDQLGDDAFYGAAITMLLHRFDGNFIKARAYLLTHGAKQIAKELLATAEAWKRGDEEACVPYDLLVPVGSRTYGARLKGEQRQAVKKLAGERKAEVTAIKSLDDAKRFVRQILPLEAAPMNRSDQPFPNAYVLAVAANKGGCGKTTLSASIGFAAARAGIKTLIIDVDVHGPSLGHLLDLPQGIAGKNDADGEIAKIEPHEVAENLRAFSMQQLVADGTPITWRGAAIEGFLMFLASNLDTDGTQLIVIDLPPGTGEVERAVVEHFHPDGAVLVTTGSHLAHADLRRGVSYFRHRLHPLGLVENMSRREVKVGDQIVEGRLFGEDGDTARFCESLKANDGEGIRYFGSLPFDPNPATLSDDAVMKDITSAIYQAIQSKPAVQ
jgi:ATP-binding protein involved in chromosome partitioning